MKTLQLPKVLSLSLLLALVISLGSFAANLTSEPQVKQSSSGIFHDNSSGSFNRTKNYIPFDTIVDCISRASSRAVKMVMQVCLPLLKWRRHTSLMEECWLNCDNIPNLPSTQGCYLFSEWAHMYFNTSVWQHPRYCQCDIVT
jgi:hypothetical protein